MSADPDDLSLDLARAERERRRRARLRAFPGYGAWLGAASPTFRWDLAWLRYVQGYYDRVTAGEIRKLMVFAPPQHGKSEGGTIRYPVYRMERDPATRVIVAAHSQALANKFSRKSRALAERRFALASDKKSVAEWETTGGGGLKAVGVGGSIAGNPADLLFIDDPVRNRKEAASPVVQESVYDWFVSDITTRLQESAAVIIQMTRWHELDLAGRILSSDDAPNWTVVSLPAIALADDPLGRAPGEALCPERFSIETLLNRKLTMRNDFYALYQQTPRAPEGGLFKRDWFKATSEPPGKVLARVRAWDMAATDGGGDWTVGVLVARTADGLFWVEDVVRGRWGPHERDAKILATAGADPRGTRQHFEQEPGSAGKSVVQAMARMLAGYTVSAQTPTGPKAVRAEPWASQLAAGNVRLCKANWNQPFVVEHCEFPGAHDDQVDAAASAFNRLAAPRKWEVT